MFVDNAEIFFSNKRKTISFSTTHKEGERGRASRAQSSAKGKKPRPRAEIIRVAEKFEFLLGRKNFPSRQLHWGATIFWPKRKLESGFGTLQEERALQ